jgi:hypothetical protein
MKEAEDREIAEYEEKKKKLEEERKKKEEEEEEANRKRMEDEENRKRADEEENRKREEEEKLSRKMALELKVEADKKSASEMLEPKSEPVDPARPIQNSFPSRVTIEFFSQLLFF